MASHAIFIIPVLRGRAVMYCAPKISDFRRLPDTGPIAKHGAIEFVNCLDATGDAPTTRVLAHGRSQGRCFTWTLKPQFSDTQAKASCKVTGATTMSTATPARI